MVGLVFRREIDEQPPVEFFQFGDGKLAQDFGKGTMVITTFAQYFRNPAAPPQRISGQQPEQFGETLFGSAQNQIQGGANSTLVNRHLGYPT